MSGDELRLDRDVLDATERLIEPFAHSWPSYARDCALRSAALREAERLGRPDLADALRREVMARLGGSA
jgi:hypothetical protein